MFFSLQPDKALLSDFNFELIQCYEVLKKHPVLLSRKVHEHPQQKTHYYKLRQMDPAELGQIERAARFLFLNSFCFNGVYRTNLSGQFNVPWGTKSRGVPSEKLLRRCSYYLRRAEVCCQDYLRTLKEVQVGDFVYLDPPYAKSGSRNRGEYGVGSFALENEEQLIAALSSLDRRGAKFLLSYRASSAFIEKLKPTWNFKRIRVRRNVAGFAGARRNAIEILARNYVEG